MNMPRRKRILGMTFPQWLVLGVLALFLCCVVVGGFWWLNSMVTAAYAVPNMPVSNATPLPTATLASTATPLPTPSPTPITYQSLVPAGWKQFTSTAAPGMEIWFPTSYAPLTAKEKKTSIYDIESVTSLLTLKDVTPSSYLIYTTFEIVTRPVFGGTLNEMIDAEFGTLMRTGRLLERDPFVFQTESYSAQRLIFDINISGVDAGLVIYAVQVGGDLYYLGFGTPFNELYTRLSAFDQSAQTFRIVKP